MSVNQLLARKRYKDKGLFKENKSSAIIFATITISKKENFCSDNVYQNRSFEVVEVTGFEPAAS